MNKVKTNKISIIGAVIAVTLLIGQGGGYLSQKLMVENNIRGRVKDALSKIIDSQKYVINVDVELEVLDEVNEQITVFSQRDTDNRAPTTPAEKTADALVKIQKKMAMETQQSEESYSVGLPIPGFEVDVTKPKADVSSITQSTPISPRTMEPMDLTTGSDKSDEEMVDKVLSRKRPSRAQVKRMDLTLILQEGAAPELIENIRQLAMAASKFDRNRGDKLTIMTASFKERRDQRSAEQIMLKNIAEKIDLLEKKRVAENTDWRDEIQKYRDEETARRQEDKSFFEKQLNQMEEQARAEAYAQEKKEMLRRDSLKVAKLNNEISALKDMLTITHEEDAEKQSKVDSTRFAMLDNELQSLRRMLLQAILKDSIEAQQQAQAQIELELASREEEKAKRDSLIEEKIMALEGVQTELDALQAERSEGLGTSQLLLIAFGLLLIILMVALVFVMNRNKQQAPMPPWMYPPPPRQRRKRPKKKLNKAKKEEKDEPIKDEVKEEPKEEPKETPAAIQEPVVQQATGDDPNVLKSEIDDIRKSVVSMSVGQPERTASIVKEWLEQPAPEPPAAPETPDDDGAEEEDEG
tara:strand:- start:6212 stop:7954 length:1743 start_codon:yes stop_codon:yes gene_type:complete